MIKMEELMNNNLGDGAYLADEEITLDGEGEETSNYNDDAPKENIQDITENNESYKVEKMQELGRENEETPEDSFGEDDELDFEEELTALKVQFPELADIDSIKKLKSPEKYERFRRLGLTPAEAYMASGEHRLAARSIPASPLSVTRHREGIPDRQLRMAREIFTGLTDVEIQALYRRVTK
jgi:hypothetical protein